MWRGILRILMSCTLSTMIVFVLMYLGSFPTDIDQYGRVEVWEMEEITISITLKGALVVALFFFIVVVMDSILSPLVSLLGGKRGDEITLKPGPSKQKLFEPRPGNAVIVHSRPLRNAGNLVAISVMAGEGSESSLPTYMKSRWFRKPDEIVPDREYVARLAEEGGLAMVLLVDTESSQADPPDSRGLNTG